MNVDEERISLIKLHNFFYLKPSWAWRLINLYEKASEVLKQAPAALFAEAGLPLDEGQRFAKKVSSFDAEKELTQADRMGAKVVFFDDDDYPSLLKEIPDPPILIYIKGKMKPSWPIGIVGTRKPSNYGVRSCVKLIKEISPFNISIVSGLARGIDSVAHESALKFGLQTWAVLGTGIDICYPRENKKLYARMPETGGVLISEFPLGSPPLAYHFPRRNRIISGVSHSVLVIEGGFSSGALITARFALQQGRELLALPGNIDSFQSAGPNSFIKQGAALCSEGLDIISSLPAEAFLEKKSARKEEVQEEKIPSLGGLANRVYEFIAHSQKGLTLDEIMKEFKIGVPEASGVVFELETGGYISNSEGKYSSNSIR